MEIFLTLVQRYMEHVVTIRFSVGLPGTDDPLNLKEFLVFLLIPFW